MFVLIFKIHYMANIKSSIKRIDIVRRNSLRRKKTLSKLTTITRKYYKALQTHDALPTDSSLLYLEILFRTLTSLLDKAAKVRVLHKNNVDRKKSSAHLALNNSLKKND